MLLQLVSQQSLVDFCWVMFPFNQPPLLTLLPQLSPAMSATDSPRERKRHTKGGGRMVGKGFIFLYILPQL